MTREVAAPQPDRAVHRRFDPRDFGDALAGWGRFTGADGRARSRGEWIRADGELVRGQSDRTQFDLLTVDSPRLVVVRTGEDVRRTPSTRHIVVVQLDGESTLTPYDGRPPVRLTPGEVSYGDPRVPYRWEFHGPLRLMMLRLPSGAFSLTPQALRPILGRPFGSDSGYSRLAIDFARNVLCEPKLLEGRIGPAVVRDVVRLFATTLSDRLDHAEERDPSEAMFRRAVEHIADNVSQPLDIAAIAEATGISPRYLQGLFQQRGVTVSGWVRRCRLEGARAALADPGWDSADIMQVAAAHGFAAHSHFTRAFHAAFGQTPSQWRAAVR